MIQVRELTSNFERHVKYRASDVIMWRLNLSQIIIINI